MGRQRQPALFWVGFTTVAPASAAGAGGSARRCRPDESAPLARRRCRQHQGEVALAVDSEALRERGADRRDGVVVVGVGRVPVRLHQVQQLLGLHRGEGARAGPRLDGVLKHRFRCWSVGVGGCLRHAGSPRVPPVLHSASAAQARLMRSGCTCFRMARASIVVSSGSHWSSRPWQEQCDPCTS
jgi:hypothetical protein